MKNSGKKASWAWQKREQLISEKVEKMSRSLMMYICIPFYLLFFYDCVYVTNSFFSFVTAEEELHNTSLPKYISSATSMGNNG
jgi:hypothetical protein